MFGVDIAPTVTIGPGLAIPHPVGLVIGDPARLGARVRLMSGVTIGGGGFEDPTTDGMPTIGDDCWLFDGAKVFGPITVGERVVIGANSMVIHDVPPNVFVAGNPAKIKRDRPRGNP
jgi:serine O-acetyltransferase